MDRENEMFDINTKYQHILKNANKIVKNYNINNGCEPDSKTCLAIDIKNYLPKLLQDNNNLNKGIDELLIKYEEELSKYSKLLKEANNNDILDAIKYQAICNFYIKVIQDLKKLKGE